MMFLERFRGVWVAMVTPWDETSGAPRAEVITALVQRFASAGVTGLYILGTTGEGALFTLKERMLFAEAVLQASEGKLPVIVHTGHEQTAAVIKLSLHAKRTGASAVAISPPARYRLDEEELFSHYLTVAEKMGDYPVLLYDIPSATGNPLGATLLARLRERAPNVVGAKVSRSDWAAWEEYLTLASEVTLLIGKDEMAFPLLIMGGQGLVCSGANVFPELYVVLYRVAMCRNVGEGLRLQGLISQLCRVCHQGTPLAFIKEAVTLMGYEVGPPLAPLRRLSAEERVELETGLAALKAAVSRLVCSKGGDDRGETLVSVRCETGM
jgi:4-hydroxy-tetrahydrodipicolinate synthase